MKKCDLKGHSLPFIHTLEHGLLSVEEATTLLPLSPLPHPHSPLLDFADGDLSIYLLK